MSLPALDKCTSSTWQEAGRLLVAKALAELSYEQLLTPVPDGVGSWRLEVPGAPAYRFRARKGGFGSWRVETGSVVRGDHRADDPSQLILDVRPVLGLDGPTTAEVLRELTATHVAEARLLAGGWSAGVLADLEYAELEQHLTGHPVLVLNKGRLGFSADDLDRYAPETRGTVALRWYAAHRSVATYQGVRGLDQQRLLAEELSPVTRKTFATTLASQVADPASYVWLPVHPYQDETVVRTLFAHYLADRRLVPLGEGPVAYRPVQSVRTLVANGHRDVKTPLFMRNTLVWRGLGARATAAAPDVSAWLATLPASDPELQSTGLGLLGEVASVVVAHDLYEQVPDAPYRYRELLGAVWREPVAGRLERGERARSLAALLHVDHYGQSVLAELVNRSGLTARDWLERLCDALLPGLLLCLARHGVAFCPHGENTIVVYGTDDVPVRALVKDFAEDVTLLPGRRYPGLTERADQELVRWPASEMAHSIISAVLAGHFRFLAGVAEDHLGVPEDAFWDVVRDALLTWRALHPDLQAAFDALGLLAPEVERVALNREHLTGGGFHDRANRDAAPDVVHGFAPNPVSTMAAPAAGGQL